MEKSNNMASGSAYLQSTKSSPSDPEAVQMLTSAGSQKQSNLNSSVHSFFISHLLLVTRMPVEVGKQKQVKQQLKINRY